MVERTPHAVRDRSARRHDRELGAQEPRIHGETPAERRRPSRGDIGTALARSWVALGLLTFFLYVGGIAWAAASESWAVLAVVMALHAVGSLLIVAATLRRSQAGSPPGDPVDPPL